MAITKPPVLPVWAESGDKVQPSDVEIQTGWPLSNVPPSRQRFNWFFNYVMNAVRYFSRRGLPDWDSAETYSIGDTVIGNDNAIYRSLINSNLNKTPSTSPAEWEASAPSGAALASAIQNQTYTAFTTGGTAPNYTLDVSPSITSYVAGQRFRLKIHSGTATGVAKTLNVDGLGAKSFVMRNDLGTLSNVGVPTNTLVDVEYDGTQFVSLTNVAITGADTTKTGVVRFATSAELAAKAAGVVVSPDMIASITGGMNLSGNGHYEFSGGFILNWGFAAIGDDSYTAVTFDKAFPNSFLAGWAAPVRNGAVTGPESIGAHVGGVGLSGMSVGAHGDTIAPNGVYWFAIGK